MIVVANNMRLHILLWYVPMMGVGFKGSWEFIMLTHIIHSTLSVLWVPRYNMFEQFPVLSRQWRPAHVFSPGWGKPSKENMMGAPHGYASQFVVMIIGWTPFEYRDHDCDYPCHDYSLRVQIGCCTSWRTRSRMTGGVMRTRWLGLGPSHVMARHDAAKNTQQGHCEGPQMPGMVRYGW